MSAVARAGAGLRATGAAIAHPGRWLREVTAGGPTFPLVVLFGLNAVDELDRTAFGILVPEIRDEFDLGLQGILTLIAVVSVVALLLQVPIATLADRYRRTWLAVLGAALWGFFSVLTGVAGGLIMLAIVRTGSGLGRATVDPTHNSLLADYYPPAIRPRIYSVHRAANAVGACLGPLVAGLVAAELGWRVPFILFAFPTLVFVILAVRLKEPVRGAHERRAMGADEDVVATEEEAPSFAEGWRMVHKIETLRRIWYALPFLATSLVGFVSLAALMYDEQFGLDERARGFVAAAVEPAQLIGLVVGGTVGTRLLARDPSLVLRFLAHVSVVVAACLVVFALAPTLVVAVVANAVIAAALAVLGPGILAALSLAIPPRARSIGFSVGSLWVVPGLVFLPLLGWVGDQWGIRWGMLAMVPIFLIGGAVVASAGRTVNADITQVWTSAAALAEARRARREGRSKLLVIRDLEVGYGEVQVLFGVDLEVDEGEIVALLGTNGAGKSTLLKAISGVVEADRGTVIFDGREVTHAPPHEIARHGIAQMPGGAGVFGDLTVAENLQMGSWVERRDPEEVAARMARVLEFFPILERRMADPAGDLSGGQQQMLALGMAFLAEPRLLMIDELSLGLAPVVVEQLLPVVRRLAEAGTTVIIVEQSVNVALTLADRAYFLEKGEIRFEGPTAELLERPDVLRSVFLEGADAAVGSASARPEASAPDAVPDATNRPPAAAAPAAAATSSATTDSVAAGLASTGPEPTVPDQAPVLVTEELGIRFGGVQAVNRVSLTLAPGEIVGIIGPNGAGKTTLFDLISGFVPGSSGRIQLNGHDVTERSAAARARRGLGRSFQDARLWPSLTVEEAIAVALERWVEVRDPFSAALHLPASFDAEEAVRLRVDELMELLGLEPFRSKFLRELSTGSRRIVDLACVVAHRPTVILLDEPSSGIAQRETENLVPLILRLRDELGASVLVIEHDMPLITAVSDRLVAMDQGAVVASGPPAEILRDPVVVASYLGTTETVIARSGPVRSS